VEIEQLEVTDYSIVCFRKNYGSYRDGDARILRKELRRDRLAVSSEFVWMAPARHRTATNVTDSGGKAQCGKAFGSEVVIMPA